MEKEILIIKDPIIHNITLELAESTREIDMAKIKCLIDSIKEGLDSVNHLELEGTFTLNIRHFYVNWKVWKRPKKRRRKSI